MSEAQKQSIEVYVKLLQTNAAAHALRVARKIGLLEQLAKYQHDVTMLSQACGTDAQATERLLLVLATVGIVERYGDDYALSQAARLLTSYDSDFGDNVFQGLYDYLHPHSNGKGKTIEQASAEERQRIEEFRHHQAARQWTHTPAAMQAADVLSIGRLRSGLKVLEIGGSAGVWGAAMAYRDPQMTVTTVDSAAQLQLAAQTYESIQATDRWQGIEAKIWEFEPDLGAYDFVIMPNVLEIVDDATAVVLLGRAADALIPGGEILVIEYLLEQSENPLAAATHSLELGILTPTGGLRTSAEIQRLMTGAGFGPAQWGPLNSSPVSLGLLIAQKI